MADDALESRLARVALAGAEEEYAEYDDAVDGETEDVEEIEEVEEMQVVHAALCCVLYYGRHAAECSCWQCSTPSATR
jgi:hypothetical protein